MPTRFLITGGTIDKKYDTLTGELVFQETHIPEMLDRGHFTGEKIIQVVLMKDSLEMTDEDRQLINEACEAAKEDKIVITHGTDTMVETGQVLLNNQRLANKTIVLTGAMVPYSFGESSDALFNLGTATAYSETVPTGVYIAMNGQPFNADNVRKDKSVGVFVSLNKL
jgi:L-asparaginase